MKAYSMNEWHGRMIRAKEWRQCVFQSILLLLFVFGLCFFCVVFRRIKQKRLSIWILNEPRWEIIRNLYNWLGLSIFWWLQFIYFFLFSRFFMYFFSLWCVARFWLRMSESSDQKEKKSLKCSSNHHRRTHIAGFNFLVYLLCLFVFRVLFFFWWCIYVCLCLFVDFRMK